MKQIVLNIIGIILALFSLFMCVTLLTESNVKKEIETKALQMDKECYTKEDILRLTSRDSI
ncbi:MAG: hypothetical protein PQJ49_06255 [Sphaerochaetaceae bacterium]|nr:hypothetical protein [Sphaerochaetaceae bacterium]